MADAPTELELKPPGPDRAAALAPTVFLFLFLASIASMFVLFQAFVTDFILALILVSLAYPRYLKLRAWTGNAWMASTLLTSVIALAVGVPVLFLAISLSREAATAYELTSESVSVANLQRLLFGDGWFAEQLQTWSHHLGISFTASDLKDWIAGAAGTIATFVYSEMNQVLASVVSGAFHAFIILLVVFYLFIDGMRLKQWLYRLSPLPLAQEELIAQKFGAVGRAILLGNGSASVMQGVLAGFAMWLVGLPSAVMWGTIMSLLAFLPMVGITLVVVPATVYLVLVGQYAAAAFFFSFCGLEALIIDNVVKTRLIGSHIKMHDLLIFLSIIGGLAVFGLVGILYGPLLVVLFLTLCDLFEVDYKHRLVANLRAVGRDTPPHPSTIDRLRSMSPGTAPTASEPPAPAGPPPTAVAARKTVVPE